MHNSKDCEGHWEFFKFFWWCVATRPPTFCCSSWPQLWPTGRSHSSTYNASSHSGSCIMSFWVTCSLQAICCAPQVYLQFWGHILTIIWLEAKCNLILRWSRLHHSHFQWNDPNANCAIGYCLILTRVKVKPDLCLMAIWEPIYIISFFYLLTTWCMAI